MTNGNESKLANNRELSLKLLVVLSKAYKVIMDRAMRDMKKIRSLRDGIYRAGTAVSQGENPASADR